jgi:hypothetical protein
MTDYVLEIHRCLTEAHAIPYYDGTKEDRRRHDALYRRAHDLKEQAAQAFADLNGWSWGKPQKRPYFEIEVLVRGGVHDPHRWIPYSIRQQGTHIIFDHVVYFREKKRPYRAVAVVGQPYNTSLDKAEDFAESIALDVKAPRPITASFHYPGACRFFCFVRRGTAVQFLKTEFSEKNLQGLVQRGMNADELRNHA